MSSTSVALVERFYAAVAAGDLTTALGILGGNVTWHEAPGMPYDAGHPYHGAQEVAEHVLGPITTDIEGLALVNREFIDLGANVIVVGRYTGTAHATGRALDLPYVHAWRLNEDADQVREFHQFTDTTRFHLVTTTS